MLYNMFFRKYFVSSLCYIERKGYITYSSIMRRVNIKSNNYEDKFK